MDRRHVIETLRSHELELRAAGIVHLSVFGSVARDEASLDSDIDLLAEFDQSKLHTLVSVGRLEIEIGDLLDAKVDLSTVSWLKESVRQKAMSEAVLAF
ncbi:hypothetical protein HNQ77_000288 [Silvibacterium bohemicum]|uniref:Polymerase nucleotidyl transferase domain-containing protein n=1 Tax=Silvibacterium bohemicum TaxID=1577686 RepID=A0A841JMJ2_9BACT|nr:nucleotidyltransferase domain-containing protein [Silvibacterium bohemicum]MBB6142350.1 hypothetical protein [Silvibacterium bohemicum]